MEYRLRNSCQYRRSVVSLAGAALATFALFGDLGPAAAMSDVYCARISEEDHYNSNGEALGSIGAILRQDRANFHTGRHIDRDDQDDAIFADKTSRAFLEEAINASVRRAGSPGIQAIFDTNPRVCVEIDGDTATIRSVR